jgi:NADPH:quinone reductase-like Zn-dependent oxidoreductase
MKAIVFDRFGEPDQVLGVRDAPVPEPRRGEVRVRMIASPINPSDLLYVRGEYGRRPALPATPGFEGVGVIDAAGPGIVRHLRGLTPGRRVAVLNGLSGNWQEQVVIPAQRAVPVPRELSDDQAATFFVNPASALVMTRYVLKMPHGSWLLQTAAGSALGRMVIRLGRKHGFRTINVVRRREQAEELLRLGADAAICTADESILPRVQAITQGAGVPFALDAVGGATGSEVAQALGADGRMLVYGTLSMEPLSIEPRLLIAGHKQIEGFWLSDWAAKQSMVTMLGLFRRVGALLREGVLSTEIGKTFPMDQVQAAVRQAAQAGRQGKVLLRFGPGPNA